MKRGRYTLKAGRADDKSWGYKNQKLENHDLSYTVEHHFTDTILTVDNFVSHNENSYIFSYISPLEHFSVTWVRCPCTKLQCDYSNQGQPTKFSTNLTNENPGG